MSKQALKWGFVGAISRTWFSADRKVEMLDLMEVAQQQEQKLAQYRRRREVNLKEIEVLFSKSGQVSPLIINRRRTARCLGQFPLMNKFSTDGLTDNKKTRKFHAIGRPARSRCAPAAAGGSVSGGNNQE